MRLFVVRFLKTQKTINMLLPEDIHPENSIYYNGAIVLKVLQEHKKLGMLELYKFVREEKNISFPVFVLCIDWLYLISVAELKEGKVSLCS